MQDNEHFYLIRQNVDRMLKSTGIIGDLATARVLDIAPQDHKGARYFFPPSAVVETLDIDPQSKATYIADICDTKGVIAPSSFDVVVCTEVLEHVSNPFMAVDEIRRMLRPGGLLIGSTPFNFRIHGPLPDCWRFTEHGLRALLRNYAEVQIDALETKDRPLMPVHYTFKASVPW